MTTASVSIAVSTTTRRLIRHLKPFVSSEINSVASAVVSSVSCAMSSASRSTTSWTTTSTSARAANRAGFNVRVGMCVAVSQGLLVRIVQDVDPFLPFYLDHPGISSLFLDVATVAVSPVFVW